MATVTSAYSLNSRPLQFAAAFFDAPLALRVLLAVHMKALLYFFKESFVLTSCTCMHLLTRQQNSGIVPMHCTACICAWNSLTSSREDLSFM